MSWIEKRPYCPEVAAWQSMWYRCCNDKCPSYHRYGGRGIRVCERWRDFFAFMEDMGRRPSAEHSLDRIDVNGDYCPENCRWATRDIQGNNRSTNVKVTINGKTQTKIQWLRELGFGETTIIRWRRRTGSWEAAFAAASAYRNSEAWAKQRPEAVTAFGKSLLPAHWATEPECAVDVGTLYFRLSAGWSPEEALSTPARSARLYTAHGKTASLDDWAEYLGLTRKKLEKRLKMGHSPEEAFCDWTGKKRSDAGSGNIPKILELFDQGVHQADIAKQLELAVGHVRKVLHDHRPGYTNPTTADMVEWEGEKIAFPDLCRRYGKEPGTVRARMARGMSLKEALETPLEREPVPDYSHLPNPHGLSDETIRYRIRNGWSVEDALKYPPFSRKPKDRP